MTSLRSDVLVPIRTEDLTAGVRLHRLGGPRSIRWMWRLLVVVLVFVPCLLIAAVLVAQPRPGIPEQRCQDVRVELAPGTDGARGMGLRVVNVDPGDFDARLHRDVIVEREVNGAWERMSTVGFELRERCNAATPECIRLQRRSSITIVPWTGMQGDAQCYCTRCRPAPAGRYRFAVASCHCQHPRVTYSDPFSLSAP